MDVETVNAIESVRTDLREVETSLRADLRRVETSLRNEMREMRTHSDMGFQSLRDDIQLLAESVVSLHFKVDSLSHPGQ